METAIPIVILVGALIWAVLAIAREQGKNKSNEKLEDAIKKQELDAQARDEIELASADAKRVVGFLNSLREDD